MSGKISNLELLVVTPNTAEARALGCICPDPAVRASFADVIFICGGHLFAVSCPIHHHAIMAEMQRLFGSSH